jgi:hypothetical protein
MVAITQIVVLLLHMVMLTNTDVSEEHSASIFNPEEGGSMFLQNIYIHLQDCTLSQSRTPQSKN